MRSLEWGAGLLGVWLAVVGVGCADDSGEPDTGSGLDTSVEPDVGLDSSTPVDGDVDSRVADSGVADSGPMDSAPMDCAPMDAEVDSGAEGRCTPGDWTIEEISGVGSYAGSGIGVDAAGTVYVAARRGVPGGHRIETRSRAFGETAWTDATLAGGFAMGGFDFHVTPAGDRFASYYRTGAEDAYLSHRLATGAAGTEMVSSDWDAGRHSAVAVDPMGDAHVIFHQYVVGLGGLTSGQPHYRRRSADGSWAPAGYEPIISPFTVGEVRGENISAVADATRVFAVYWDREDGGLYRAHRPHATAISTAGAWTVRRIGSGASSATDVALDSSGGVHIIGSTGSTWAYYHGGEREVPDMAGGFASSIAVDAWGEAHVGYGRDGAGTLYARRDSSGWSLSPVDAAGLGEVSVAVDASGAVHLAYFHAGAGGNRIVTYATGCP